MMIFNHTYSFYLLPEQCEQLPVYFNDSGGTDKRME
jgi:hypothetical protein